jgi:EAL domain-containing protein (putative c-di-GMP-specific phosphodiesterase class I)
MRAADIAMNYAKEHGRDNVQFFTPQLSEGVTRRLELAHRLRRALAQREFVLHYQPQIELGGGGLVSVEALLRWQPADGPLTSCGDFSAVAEETGLIVPIGEWTLREAGRQLRAWREQGHDDLRVALNVSPRQLCEAEFHEMVCDVLREYDLPGAALEIEITESVLLPQLETLAALATLGVRFAVDDFGVGYSNLAYLRRLPISTLKIDRSFVGGVGRTTNDTAIVNAIVAMAKSLGLRIVAEGVESADQLLFLEAVGCHAVQGFLFSAAQPAHVIGSMLGTESPALTNPPCHVVPRYSGLPT